MIAPPSPGYTDGRRPCVAATLLLALAITGCSPRRPPPPDRSFAGLPVSGDRAFARRSGFGACLYMDAVNLRCRRHGVMLYGHGPYEAALDLRGGSGEQGFDQLTLWHDDDQTQVYQVIIGLSRAGWTYCYTGTEMFGDQAVFTKPGAPVRISMDISYWGKRRIRILPMTNPRERGRACRPDSDLVRFGADVAAAASMPSDPDARADAARR